MNTNRQAYNATVELAFDYKGRRTNIPSEKISYIMISHDYINQVLPIIFISLSVNSDLYTKITTFKDDAKFFLSIKKVNLKSVLGISKGTISGTFNYIPSTTNPNFQEDISDKSTNIDSSYRRIMIGLVSVELTNKLRKSFNGIYNNIDTNTLIAMALDGTNCIVEPIKYNTRYESIIIPPLASRYKLLEHVFDKDMFYDTNFRYFMDFDRSYLTSKAGVLINANDGKINNILIDIRSVIDKEAYYSGIEIKNNSYCVYINPADSHVSINQGTEKVANQIVSIDEDNPQTLDLDINRNSESDTKQTFIRTTNAALYKNELETNTISIEVLKNHIDGSIFTPNCTISVSNYGNYSKYDGKYLLCYKKEFFKCVAGKFVMSCVLGLRKIGNIQPAKVENQLNTSKYASGRSSAIRKSTSTVKNNNVKATIK